VDFASAVQAEQRIDSEVAQRLEAIGSDRATWPAAAREEVRCRMVYTWISWQPRACAASTPLSELKHHHLWLVCCHSSGPALTMAADGSCVAGSRVVAGNRVNWECSVV
jgi:hypothetical protein